MVSDSKLFQIAILDESVNSKPPGLGYSMETAWPVLQEAYPSKVVHEITTEDIEAYSWNDQVMRLTIEATNSFREKYNYCEVEGLDTCISNVSFMVIYDDQPMYGGIFLNKALIATAYKFPVIYLDQTNGQVDLILRPNNSVFENFTDEEWQIIKDDRIKTLFENLGKYEE